VGNGDIYHFPCYALEDGQIELYDRVCQMRINKAMPQINFMEVDDMQSEDRQGFGSTGTR
jgi:dUTP pyrophosphatase